MGPMNFDITMWLTLALFISITMNVVGFWYIRKLLSNFLFISENIGDLVTLIENYKKHLTDIYKLDMYYGDETIKFMMSHTTSLLEVLEDYEDIYSISIPLEEPEFTDLEEELNGTTEEEIDKENVFYAGSRKRDS